MKKNQSLTQKIEWTETEWSQYADTVINLDGDVTSAQFVVEPGEESITLTISIPHAFKIAGYGPINMFVKDGFEFGEDAKGYAQNLVSAGLIAFSKMAAEGFEPQYCD